MKVRATTRIVVKGIEHQEGEVFDYDGAGHVCLEPVKDAPAKPAPGKKKASADSEFE